MTPTKLRIAVSQLRMDWSGDANTRAIVRDLDLAASAGARFCLFPELAVTGIHRRIAEVAKAELVSAWLARVAAACAEHSIAASVGAPAFDASGAIRIAQHFYDPRGACVGTVDKSGLTAPEATFFVPGRLRANVELLGRCWNAMICREVEDADQLAPVFLADPPDIVVWPGAMRPDPAKPRVEPPEHVRQAQQFACRCEVFVIQANWPNALNRPEESVDGGRSVVIAPSGDILLTLPQAQPGLAIFDLGANSFDWRADDASA